MSHISSADQAQDSDPSAVAIIGMAGRFSGARDVNAFWQNLCDGIEAITFFSDQELTAAGVSDEELRNPKYVKAAMVLDDVELFDAFFFGLTPREAEVMDPQQRFFLECAWEALENAGYNPESYQGAIGVYAGSSTSSYLLNNLWGNPSVLNAFGRRQTLLFNDKDFLATRASYLMNLRGPSFSVQTACSTSLVAVHLACQSLLNGECDIALAGGVAISVPQRTGYLHQDGDVLSPDGHCRAFDARAQGTVVGNGVGIVVLKRLSDALVERDTIYAVIRGSAINNDGSLKVGYTAPSVKRQADVVAEALAVAGIDPETIGYVETHGTGTPIGDPIEIAALTQAYRMFTGKKGFCAIGSVKTNIGHLDAAAGVTGLIKTVLALQNKLLPPSLNFENPNPQINFKESPFYVNTALSAWEGKEHPRRAGVSSFGIGGTNVHVVLEEAPASKPTSTSKEWHLLTLSAKTASGLENRTADLLEYLKRQPDVNIADVAHTLLVGRKTFNHRRMVLCNSVNDAIQTLSKPQPERVLTMVQEAYNRPVVFMFPGGGSQHVYMGYNLYQSEQIYREQIDRCAELLQAHLDLDIRELLYPASEREKAVTSLLRQTGLALPALFATEYALAKLLMAWGIQPQAMIGHSLGEYVAACLAEVFSLEAALMLVVARGRLMQQAPQGAMLAVPLSEKDIQGFLSQEISLAAINGPSMCVVSGPVDSIDTLGTHFRSLGVECRRLHIDVAAHSELVTPILQDFARVVEQVHLCEPKIPYVSNVTGTWIQPREATDPSYWGKHLRQTVRFAQGVHELLANTDRILLEVGPGNTLTTLIGSQLEAGTHSVLLPAMRHLYESQSDVASVLKMLGKLWLSGGEIAKPGPYMDEHRQRIPLPAYPFERKRYWVDPPAQTVLPGQPQIALETSPEKGEQTQFPVMHSRPHHLLLPYEPPNNDMQRQLVAIWEELFGLEPIGIHDNFFELGGNSLMLSRLVPRFQAVFPVEIPLRSLFEAPTIARLAEVIEEIIITKLEELPDETIHQLYQDVQGT